MSKGKKQTASDKHIERKTKAYKKRIKELENEVMGTLRENEKLRVLLRDSREKNYSDSRGNLVIELLKNANAIDKDGNYL